MYNHRVTADSYYYSLSLYCEDQCRLRLLANPELIQDRSWGCSTPKNPKWGFHGNFGFFEKKVWKVPPDNLRPTWFSQSFIQISSGSDTEYF